MQLIISNTINTVPNSSILRDIVLYPLITSSHIGVVLLEKCKERSSLGRNRSWWEDNFETCVKIRTGGR